MYRECTIFGEVNQGRLGVYNVHTWNNYLKHWEGSEVHVQVRDPLLKYDHKLLGYYFHVMVPQATRCMRSFGHNTNEDKVDRMLRSLYLTEKIHDPDADQWLTEVRTLARDKTTVTTAEFIEYIHQVIAWIISTFDWCIPYPGEVLRKTDIEPQGCLSAMTDYQRRAISAA